VIGSTLSPPLLSIVGDISGIKSGIASFLEFKADELSFLSIIQQLYVE